MGVIQDSLLPVHSTASIIEVISIVTLSAAKGLARWQRDASLRSA